MTTISNYPSGFNELVLREVPMIIPNPGKVYWVSNADILLNDGNSVAGVDQSGGGTYQRPFRTVDYAIGQCTANRGDVVYVMPGHSEEITGFGTVDFDVAGMTAIGLGQGTLRPRFDVTVASAYVDISASNVSLVNFNVHANVSAVVAGITVDPGVDDTLLKGLRFDVELTGTDEFLSSIAINTSDRTIVEDCFIDMGLGGAATGINSPSAADGCIFRRNTIIGDYSVANIAGTVSASTNMLIEHNLLLQGYTGALNAVACISMHASTTGIVRHNDIVCDVATFALQTVANGMSFINNNRTDDIAAAKTSSVISASVTVSADA